MREAGEDSFCGIVGAQNIDKYVYCTGKDSFSFGGIVGAKQLDKYVYCTGKEACQGSFSFCGIVGA